MEKGGTGSAQPGAKKCPVNAANCCQFDALGIHLTPPVSSLACKTPEYYICKKVLDLKKNHRIVNCRELMVPTEFKWKGVWTSASSCF